MKKYKDYIIEYDNPMCGINGIDWCFCHNDYDGAPDAEDYRCGRGSSIDDCKEQINNLEL